ncbi:hypothetical protein GMLC_21790 [Geomonas limicola]|uniref:Phosphate-starvation-inducible E-like protein n=1 Tax=Geomonas limicola TaxID=2740186 RepID=A0A6V8N868_9BACT|nr:phosphate-starvation-inducible PsiE family protein [Geomonas limicola]GFO68600.1 hypothetical protein GMLC_21790 [Geomonas limicola]
MLPVIKSFEKIIVRVLVVMMIFVLLLATVELAWVIIKDVITPPTFLLEIDELLDIFGLFMLVLIGIELLDTIAKTYMGEATDHAQIVMAVAIIAIARKVIILDVKDLSGLALLGIAAIILALSIGYYLITRKTAAANAGTHDPTTNEIHPDDSGHCQ